VWPDVNGSNEDSYVGALELTLTLNVLGVVTGASSTTPEFLLSPNITTVKCNTQSFTACGRC